MNANLPWYRRTFRWGQTNLTEIDPRRYDSAFWRNRWKETRIEGVIVNAGGIVAYYPSGLPQHRATGLGDRDFYGDIVGQARADGLTVIARMDSNRADEALFQQRPDWFTRDVDGRPYMAGPNYVACVNGPYYTEFLPEVFAEIIDRSHPDGFADNSWAGLDATKICYCDNCRRSFDAATSHELPARHDWDDPVYRDWIRWNLDRRTAIWRENSERTSQVGGPDCIWVGMVGGDQAAEVNRFVNIRAIAAEAKIFFVDHQRRTARDGFMHNSDTGKRLHGVLGWDRLMPESMAMYSAGLGFFRATSMPAAEVGVWAAAGFAGGIQPWWHHISAVHEDLRQYDTPLPIFAFHERNQRYLVDRTPLAEVAVVWSEQNTLFHGRSDRDNTAINPYRGVVTALSRAAIPYLPVHLDDLDRLDPAIRVVVLPDTAVMTDAQADTIRALVGRGVSIVATGETGLKDADGIRRRDFAIADVLGVHATGGAEGSREPLAGNIEVWDRHNYLRISRGAVPGSDEEAIFDGLAKTNLVSFGGRLEQVRAERGAVLMTYVTPFPNYPPEFAWLPAEPTDIPALVVRADPNGAKIAYLAGDLDRIAGRELRPDHLRLIGNIVGWQLGAHRLIEVGGPRGVDVNVYRQEGRLIVHLVHIEAPSPIPGTLDELGTVGPFEITLRQPDIQPGATGRTLVLGQHIEVDAADGTATFTVAGVRDHEIVVIEL